MQPEHKEAWITALRSGKYPQTKGVLHQVEEKNPDRPAGYCCLGVACDIFADKIADFPRFIHNGVEAFGTQTEMYLLPADIRSLLNLDLQVSIAIPFNDIRYWYDYDQYSGLVNQVTRVLLEVDEANRAALSFAFGNSPSKGDFYPTLINTTLTALNDHDLPFTVIADMIERYL